MDFESIAEQFLFSKIRDGREGIQLQRTFRAISFLLNGWSTFDGDRKPLYKNEKKDKTTFEPLPVIHFEKFSLLAARIWKKVYYHTKNGIEIENLSTQRNDLEIVTFPFPFQEYPAKHGRRLRRINGNNKYVYIIKILHELLDECIYYFEIVTSPKDPDNPNNYATIVRPAFPMPNRKEFLQCFNPFEMEILFDLENSLKRLGASQIRALGTHENKEKTIYDIKKEFLDMSPYIVSAIYRLSIDDSFFDSSYEIMTYADEAWRKSIYNRQEYKEAYELMLREIKNPQLLKAFSACQSSPEEIWDGAQLIDEHSHESEVVKAFSMYLNAVAYYRDNVKVRTKKRKSAEEKSIDYQWTESLQRIKECGLTGLKSNLNDIFIGSTSKIKANVRHRLISELKSVQTWIRENTKHAQRELCLSKDASGP